MTFPRTWRGYDPAVVDAQVTALREETARLRAERDELTQEVADLRSADRFLETSAAPGDDPRRAGDLMSRAEREGRRLHDEAQAEADRLRDEAGAEAHRLRDEARAEAARVKTDAAGQAAALVRAAREQAELLEERSRQELAWRRRQLAGEMAEVARRQRELFERDPGEAGDPGTAEVPDAADDAQKSRALGSSSPRSTS